MPLAQPSEIKPIACSLSWVHFKFSMAGGGSSQG
jgi:hypothetical protein